MSERKCSVEGCDRRHVAKGLCGSHYQRRHSGYQPDDDQPLRVRKTKPKPACGVDGCNEPGLRVSGYCRIHHRRMKQTGHPEGVRAENGDGEAWLRAHVTFDGKECLEWPFGKMESGYGAIIIDDYYATASRHMARLIHGDLSSDTHVLHHCDNPPCCNPAHLFLGTARDNVHDMIRKGRRGKCGGKRKLNKLPRS